MQSVLTQQIEFKAVNYPLTIVRGCAALDEIPEFSSMPDGYLRILMRLIKKIDVIKPEKAIFARRSTLSKESGKSEITVNRALKWLEDHQMITRKQVCKSNLKGSNSPITPTKKLINLLGFGDKPKKAPANKNECSLSEKQNLNINKQSDQSSCLNPPSKTVIQGVALPHDLVWLVTKGRLNPYAVLKLMKLATDSGKFLSDIVQATKKWLEVGKVGKALYAYLLALIKQKKDFKTICAEQNRTYEAVEQSQADKQLVERKGFEWQAKTFESISTKKQYRIDSGYIYEIENSKIAGSRFMDIGFVNAVMDGKLRMTAG